MSASLRVVRFFLTAALGKLFRLCRHDSRTRKRLEELKGVLNGVNRVVAGMVALSSEADYKRAAKSK